MGTWCIRRKDRSARLDFASASAKLAQMRRRSQSRPRLAPRGPTQDADVAPADARSRWQPIVDVLTAAGGAVVLLYGIGGVVVGVRLSALELPIEAALAAIPTSALLITGIRALGPGLLVASAL